tara:strand:+ start:815 stop:1117 length:303 start_codon:yes stop_codon:yes gene_type:complete
MSSSKNQGELKFFFIKLIGITFAVIVILNVTYNLILADKLENINKLLSLNDKENVELVKDKIRLEIENGLRKDKILNDKDKVLLYKFYLKIKNEFQEIEK